MIDWKNQWELHAPHFSEGVAHVPLQEYGGPHLSFKMAPGPGFGDLSHPTTQLMLHLMPSQILSPVIDVGCGSGVLSIAAKIRGAPSVTGIDIDKDAVIHAQHNAQLNNVSCHFQTALSTIPEHALILMNMISSEQKIAWKALPIPSSYTLILSGLPVEEGPPLTHYGKILKEKESAGWKAFVIQK